MNPNLLGSLIKSTLSTYTLAATSFSNLKHINSATLVSKHLRSISNMASPEKVAKKDQPKYIGTHDGIFHCDDVTACYMLKQLPRFKSHEIIRTRDPEQLALAEIVVDVGGELNESKLRLDHHQRSFNQTIKDYHPNLETTNPNKPVKLSSAGLVYAIFGHDIIASLLNLPKPYNGLDETNRKMVDAIYEKIYVEFIEEIDGIDNGFETVTGENLIYNYHISTGLSSRIGRLNPLDAHATNEERLQLFHRAMRVVEEELSEGIKFCGTVWWPLRKQFRQLVIERQKFEPSGQVIRVTGDLTSWKSNIMEIEEELGIVGEIKFIVYADRDDRWRVTAMPVSLKSFQCRVPLKAEWCGLRDEELAKVSGVEDAIFVHGTGFTGGAKSLDGVMNLIRQTINLKQGTPSKSDATPPATSAE